MRKLIIGAATGAAFVLSASAGQAMPVTGNPMRDAADTASPIEKTAVYVFEGRRYCFYFDG